jgi:hypothetical protein
LKITFEKFLQFCRSNLKDVDYERSGADILAATSRESEFINYLLKNSFTWGDAPKNKCTTAPGL